MPKDSNRKKHLRQQKRRASIAERYIHLSENVVPRLEGQLQETATSGAQLAALLYAIVAQQGGSAEVTKGTQAQVLASFQRLRLETGLKEGDAETLVVTLVEAPEVAAGVDPGTEPAYTITKIDEQEDENATAGN